MRIKTPMDFSRSHLPQEYWQVVTEMFDHSFPYSFRINVRSSHADILDRLIGVENTVVCLSHRFFEDDPAETAALHDFYRIKLTAEGRETAQSKPSVDQINDILLPMLWSVRSNYEVICRKDDWDNRSDVPIEFFWRPYKEEYQKLT